MLKVYKCIKEFYVDSYDESWCSADDYMTVEVGSRWMHTPDDNFIGGDVHLVNMEDFSWIEISFSDLDNYFIEDGEVDE